MPDLNITADWPHIADPLNITAADHAAHTPKTGVHHPEDVGMDNSKAGKTLLKLWKRPRVSRPHRRKHA